TPVRVVVNEAHVDVGDEVTSELLSKVLEQSDGPAVFDEPGFREQTLPDLIQVAQHTAAGKATEIIERSRKDMTSQLQHEISRLRQLQQVNRAVRPEEIELLIEQHRALDEHLLASRLRLDALRLIRRG